MVKAGKPVHGKPRKAPLRRPEARRKTGGREQKRMNAILVLSGVFFAVVILRLFQIQIVMGGSFRDASYEMREGETTVTAVRGSIYDANGEELALDTSVYSLWIDPEYLRSHLADENLTKDEAAQKIAAVLGYEKAYVLRKLELNSSYYWLKKNVSFEEVEGIRKLEITGLYFKEESARYYPDHSVGGNLLGFVNKTGVGVAGIESTFNDLLQGEDGFLKGQKDGQGNYIPDTLEVDKEPVPGKSIVLTIDQKAQYIVEREIERIRTELDPRSAVIMVMETKTGAIVASANTNVYDPNSYKDLDKTLFTTLEFQSVYEPGSTMKTITAAAALNEGTVAEDTPFYGNGYRKIGTETVKCWIYPRSHGEETATQGFANSCNPVFVDIALDLKAKDKNAWFRYLDAFGFGRKTAINFGGESIGIMPKGTGDIYHATSAIGQGIAVTPIQMISAVSAVANDGQKMKPYLVKEVRDVNGKVLESYEPTIEGQVVSKDAAEAVQRMMREVIVSGTGKNFELGNGIASIGKTGTAQLVDASGGYSQGKYVISYVGVAPQEDPRYTVFVIIDAARKGGQTSSTVAPYYKAVMEDILNLYNISSQNNQAAGTGLVFVPDLTGLRVEEAVRLCAAFGLRCAADGTGYVTGQDRKPFAVVSKGTEIRVSAAEKAVGENGTIIPSFLGLRLPDAILLAENAGLKLTVSGTGKVVSQGQAPGTLVEKNTAISVKLGE